MGDKQSILYIVRYPEYELFNLKGKFDGEINGFRRLGFRVRYIVFDKEYFYLTNGKNKKRLGRSHFQLPNYIHTFFYHDLYRYAEKALKFEKIDYVYWRCAPTFMASYKLARSIKKYGADLIYEIPTFPVSHEAQLNKARELFMHYSAIWDKKMLPYIDKYVVMGEDAGGSYQEKPAINIENGIDIQQIRARVAKTDTECIHILALASMCYWHGYDLLLESLAGYHGDQRVKIHFVGGNDGGYLNEWMELADRLGLQDSVIFHGKMYGAELDDIFDLCDVGVTSLRRKDYTYISELKTREYAAHGLPFIISANDITLEEARECLWLQLTNDESVPDMLEIVNFALLMREDKEHIIKLRRFAAEHMSWEAQFKKVF